MSLFYNFKFMANNKLIASIIVGSLLISGSLVFLGLSYSTNDLKAEIRLGIDEYVQEQQAAYYGDTAQNPDQNVPDDSTGAGKAATTRNIEGDLSDNDAVLGKADAPVTIVEFSDYQCPYCGKFYNEAYQQLKTEYVDTGKVKIVFRDFPLSFHAGAYPAALTAECVRDQKGDSVYFEMHNKIFEDQSILDGSTESIKEALAGYASDLGVDSKKYNECVDGNKFQDEIYADQADAQAAGISGTPSFIVDGKILVGAQPFTAFESIIEHALAK